MNRVIEVDTGSKGYEYDKYIIKPRLQIEEEGFEYIESLRGYMEDGQYFFEDVKMTGDLGEAESGRLVIRDNKNILNFTVNPKFTIYLDSMHP